MSELADHALINWEYLTDYLQLEESTKYFAVTLINAASSMAEGHTDRKLKRRDHVELYSGSGKPTIVLRQFPVESISDVRIDSSGEFGEETIVEDVRLDAELGIVYRRAGFVIGWNNVRVDYRAGYEPVPADLKIAVCEIVDWLWKRVRANQIGIKQIQADGVNTSYELTMPTNAMRILEFYRRAYAEG